MAGKFRGEVGKLSKPKKSKAARKAKGKKTLSMVKRSPKLPEDRLQSRIAELTSAGLGTPSSATTEQTKKRSTKLLTTSSTAAAVAQQPVEKPIGRAAIEIVGSKAKRERVVPTEGLAPQRTTAEAVGLRALHQAVKEQSHNRLLPHQNRHDYEYRLRAVATMGVVQLFNSLAHARKASSVVEAEDTHLTADKATEKKEVVSREAFLAALRQPQKLQQF